MFTNIKAYREFVDQVELLWSHHYDELELEELPCSPLGGFHKPRFEAFLKLVRLHPELHVVSCLGRQLYVNGFVRNALIYYLARGDSDPRLIYDPENRLDLDLLHGLNSGRNKLCP